MKLTIVQKHTNWGAMTPSGKYQVKYHQCNDTYVPGLDRRTGQLKTGLTPETEKEMENLLRLPAGTLAPSSPYWDSFRIVIPASGLFLNVEAEPMHKLYEYVFKADPTIAIGEAQLKTNPSMFDYLLSSETDKAKTVNKDRKLRNEAISKFESLTQAEVVDILALYGIVAENMDPEVAYDKLATEVETRPAKFLSFVNDKNLSKKIEIIKYVKKGIIRKATVSSTFDQPLYFGEISLGKTLEEAIDFLQDKENQNVVLSIKKQYTGK